MTDCSSFHGSTSSSSDIVSSRGGAASSRIRIIRLIRPHAKRILLSHENNVAFGFAIRGGKEYSTGFFVSRIEKGSEADLKGLRVGDQIIRANGYSVDDAVHKELLQFISSQDRLTLKVRGVGMLPIKDKPVDPLTWMIVPHRTLSALTELEEMACKTVRIVMKVAPRTKLGLGICKGPEWKPGIYVQFTKENGVARDAGLRPGDQILSCNSIDFSDVLFSEAVAVMKSSQTLDMEVRTGAGLDLFPGESSGYNSSASSVTGDQSPCWGDQASKRLSIVKEENSSNKLDLHTRLWTESFSTSRQREQLKRISSDQADRLSINGDNNRTIIQLSEKGTVINNTLISNTNTSVHLPNGMDNITVKQNSNVQMSAQIGDNKSMKLNFENLNNRKNSSFEDPISPGTNRQADVCYVSKQSETKTVIVEVHRSATEEGKTNSTTTTTTNSANCSNNPSSSGYCSNNSTAAPVPPPKPPKIPSSASSSDENERCPSVASFSSSGTTSLGSAISEELKKRQERRCNPSTAPTVDYENLETNLKQQPKRFGNPSLGGNSDDRRHSALMDEFKRAHRKMFKNNGENAEENAEETCNERKEELSKTAILRDEVDHVASNGHTNGNVHQFPTPPPPPQFANSPPSPVKVNTLRKHTKLFQKAPELPTPDYDMTPTHTLPKQRSTHNPGFMNGTLKSVSAAESSKANGDAAELESLESFQLKNPSSPIPRPPSLYFAAQSSGPPTMKKLNKSVSVTIGEYGGAQNGRKEPSKFAFISTNKMSPTNGHSHPQKEENVSEMLRSELEKTLSRSNLKKRNDPQNGFSNQNGVTETNGHSNGTSSIPPPPPLKTDNPIYSQVNNKPVLQKTQSSNIEKLTNMLQSRQLLLEMNNNRTDTMKSSNKVTISIPNKQELRKTESFPITPSNGILKNGYSKANYGEKSISFGN